MLTIAQTLADRASRIKHGIEELLGKHSLLLRRPQFNIPVLNPKGDHIWKELSVEGGRLQAKILDDYREYYSLVQVLTNGLPDGARRECQKADDLIRQHVEQQDPTWCNSPAEAVAKTLDALERIAAAIERLYSREGAAIYVPDTNALIANSDFSKWHFDDCTRFEIVFTPSVLCELDELKVSHRNQEVRTKAESVIHRIKELGRRGDLREGVLVVKDLITARCAAVEPDMSKSLPWLDADNLDDRFLASVVEIVRKHTRSSVKIVTRDVNLQNKAGFAGIPYCEPPPLVEGAAQGGEHAGSDGSAAEGGCST